MSGYNNDLYNTLGWGRQDVPIKTIHGKIKTECLWRNYTLEHEGQQLAFA